MPAGPGLRLMHAQRIACSPGSGWQREPAAVRPGVPGLVEGEGPREPFPQADILDVSSLYLRGLYCVFISSASTSISASVPPFLLALVIRHASRR